MRLNLRRDVDTVGSSPGRGECGARLLQIAQGMVSLAFEELNLNTSNSHNYRILIEGKITEPSRVSNA